MCRATFRLLILQRSGDRILTDGGLTASNEGGPTVPHTTPEMRAQVHGIQLIICTPVLLHAHVSDLPHRTQVSDQHFDIKLAPHSSQLHLCPSCSSSGEFFTMSSCLRCLWHCLLARNSQDSML